VSSRRRMTPVQRWQWSILESELSGAARSIAHVLAVHMHAQDLCCQLKLATIAIESGRSVSTVKTALNELEKSRYVVRCRRYLGGSRSDVTVYRPITPGGLANYRPTWDHRREAQLAKSPAASWPNTGHRTSTTEVLPATAPPETSSPPGGEPTICPDCEVGGGPDVHADDCPRIRHASKAAVDATVAEVAA
jgi:hypothetical protein